MEAAVARGINLRKVGVIQKWASALDEQTRPETIEAVWGAFGIDKVDRQ